MASQAFSLRLAMATLCAYVPGTSVANRRSNGRLGSDSSSRERSVVTWAQRSKMGSAKNTSAADTVALLAPRRKLNQYSGSDQPSRNATVNAASAKAAATNAADPRTSVRRLMVRTLSAAVTPPSSAI